MGPGKKILCFFILLNFILYRPFAFCASDQEKAKKIEEKLIVLKNMVIQERLKLQGLNEELKGQNNKLSQENEELRQTISKLEVETEYLTDKLNQISKQPKSQAGKKIVYRADPAQQKQIQQLQQRIAELNQSQAANSDLGQKFQEQKEVLQRSIKNKDERIAFLEKQLAVALSRKEKPEEKIVYQADSAQEEEIQQLQQRIAELNQSLEEKTQEIDKNKAEIQQLDRVIDMTYNKLEDILSKNP